MQMNLSNNPWPHIFGNVPVFSVEPICQIPSARLKRNHVWLLPDSLGEYPTGYINTEDNWYFQSGGSSCSFFPIEDDDLQKMPPFALDGYQYVNIACDGGQIRCIGAFIKHGSMGAGFQISHFNLPWYSVVFGTGICTWSPQQYGSLLAYQKDADNYIPNTVIMQGYGSFTPVSTFNIHGELSSEPTDISTSFPLVGFNTDPEPWLKGLFVKIRAYRIFIDMNNQRKVRYITAWAKVVDQDGLTLFLSDIKNEYDQDISLSGYTVCYIDHALQNKLFFTFYTTGTPYCKSTISTLFHTSSQICRVIRQ
jgi:hypothetical protein